jgi:hypothetical protein
MKNSESRLRAPAGWRKVRMRDKPVRKGRFSMRYSYSTHLRDDVNARVLAALQANGIINITVVAEEIRLRNIAENVALEDIEHLVLQAAQLYGAAIEFDELSSVREVVFPNGPHTANGHFANGHDVAALESPIADGVMEFGRLRLSN